MPSKSKHELHEERIQAVRNRIKPLILEEAKKSAMKARVRSYYRQLQGNEPIGRIEREEWEQSQRNLKNKVPEAVEAFKSAKQAIRSGTRIVEPRTRFITAKALKSSPKSPPKSSPKSPPKSVAKSATNKNKKTTESRSAAPVSSSSSKKHKTFFNTLRNVAKKILTKLSGKTRKNNKSNK
jgi:hypothetical protein